MEETGPIRILFVEDLVESQMLIKAYLTKTPFEIDFAMTEAEALEKKRSKQYNLLLINLQASQLDAYKTMMRIRKWEEENKKAETPIIALTAQVSPEEKEKAFAAGCNGYLLKPIKKAQLLELIGQFTVH